uniref:Uncharacterized protein n=1 Tax=Oryza brachyantha TaxID=4533 RepID=J3MZN7_ORYBR
MWRVPNLVADDGDADDHVSRRWGRAGWLETVAAGRWRGAAPGYFPRISGETTRMPVWGWDRHLNKMFTSQIKSISD